MGKLIYAASLRECVFVQNVCSFTPLRDVKKHIFQKKLTHKHTNIQDPNTHSLLNKRTSFFDPAYARVEGGGMAVVKKMR